MTTLSYTDTGLPPLTQVSYTISAVNTFGEGLPSLPASVTTLAALPLKPSVQAQTVSASAITLSWNNVGGSSYLITRNGQNVTTVPGQTYTDTGLSASTAYAYTVTGVNSAGQGPPSAVVSATTQSSGSTVNIQMTTGHWVEPDKGSGSGGTSGQLAFVSSLASQQYIVGVNTPFLWGELDGGTSGPDYTIGDTLLDQWVAACAGAGKKFTIVITWSRFSASTPSSPLGCCPSYFVQNSSTQPSYTLRPAGATWAGNLATSAQYWYKPTMDAFIALVQHLGLRYGTNPTVEGIAFSETANAAPTSTGNTTANAAAQWNRLMVAARQAWLGKEVRVGGNYFGNDSDTLSFIQTALTNKVIAVGGPDSGPQRSFQFNAVFNGYLNGVKTGTDYRGTFPNVSENQYPAGSSGGNTSTTTPQVIWQWQQLSGPGAGNPAIGGAMNPNKFIWAQSTFLGPGPWGGNYYTWTQVLAYINSIHGACNTVIPPGYVTAPPQSPPSVLRVASTTLDTGAANGLYIDKLPILGGTAPYSAVLNSVTGSTGNYRVTPGGVNGLDIWAYGTPTVAETPVLNVTIADSASPPASITVNFTVPITAALATTNFYQLPLLRRATKYKFQFPLSSIAAAGGTGALSCVWTGLPPGMTPSGFGFSGTTVAGSGNYNVVATVSDTAGHSQPITFSLTVAEASTGTRPVGNTGTDFYVGANGKFYDANNNEFRIRGLNRNHWDSSSNYTLTNANTIRTFVDFSRSGASNLALMQTCISSGKLAIPTNSNPNPAGTNPTTLAAAVAVWVAQASTWANVPGICPNLLNEWGPGNSTVWRDSYITAVANMRAAGYKNTLVIDSGTFGQDIPDLLNYAVAVRDSDPQKNVIFSWHDYGNTSAANNPIFMGQLAALTASAGICFIIGEFGPINIGPSQTKIPTGSLITLAEQNNLGWIAWAWDDNNLSGGHTDDGWFGMTYNGPGSLTKPGDLTRWGIDVNMNPQWGLIALAAPASSLI